MKSKKLQWLLRILIALVGAGIGIAITAGVEQVYRMVTPEPQITFAVLAVSYGGMAVLFCAVFFLLSHTILNWATRLISAIIKKVEAMPMAQLVSAMVGLIVGLVIAALMSNILRFLGDSVFTISISAIMFITLGIMGYTIGFRRS